MIYDSRDTEKKRVSQYNIVTKQKEEKAMLWSFEFNLMLFCVIVLIAEVISKKTSSRIPSVFLVGVIFMILFVGKVIPKDFIDNSYMELVGKITLTMLIINMGTTFDLAQIKKEWKTVLICLTVSLCLIVVVGFGLRPIIGKELALMSPGPVAGGGAAAAMVAAAIAQIKPQLASYPWLIFMLQGLIGFPLCSWAMRKELEAKKLSIEKNGYIKVSDQQSREGKARRLCDRVPHAYKSTAYYWSSLLVFAVLNIAFVKAISGVININTNVTAIILGVVLSQLGILERDPLGKSNSMGMLFLGLIASMANSFAMVGASELFAMVKPLVIVFAVSTLIMFVIGIVGAKVFKISKYRGIAIALNCYVGFPYNYMLCREAVEAMTEDEEKQKVLEDDLMPTMIVASLISVTLVSVIVAGLMLSFL